MLDIKLFREHPELVREGLKKRNQEEVINPLLELDQQRRSDLKEVEELKAQRNKVSEEISLLKKEKKDAQEKILSMRIVGDKIKELDNQVREIEEKINSLLLTIPNLPHSSVPIGTSDQDNPEVKKWGTPRVFDFDPVPHWELGALHDILDFERASKIAGARFPLYKGWGAKLERSLINFMLDLHCQKHGYTEIYPPILANEEALIGTGQLPKFAQEMFKCAEDPYYLISTAEISLINIHHEEILAEESLPINYTAFTPCFRREAGAAGRDTRGLIRNHQFNKVEMVKITRPEDSYNELEKLRENAEEVLQQLNLPYRVVELCTGDLGFCAAKCYDLEVWFPSQGTYREISSCSNTEDFQARRANIKFRRTPNSKPEYVHTLNGSGVAVGRTWAALVENYQNADRSIDIPEVLQPYFNGLKRIELKG